MAFTHPSCLSSGARISLAIPNDAPIGLVIPKDAHISLVIPKDAHISLVIPKDARISLVNPKDTTIRKLARLEIRDYWRFAVGCSANEAAKGGLTSADAVEQRTHGGVRLRETEREVGKRRDRGGRTLNLKKLPKMETEVETEMRRRRRDEVGQRYSSGEERRGRRR
ncbi:hypothetical protein E5676_scaffold952G00240 [Cucumis melo var. makuwa]|uniref:NBS-LRR type resistance protein n=1 Tax=Cucumis melo var. makuwa TaxID=1194695 RepID=A0A5D3CJT6_CUCMM|nr:hypothetical protein E6C27_scaffold60G001220 [Cucumis melo var. makuwa]TYK11562.1 hypothetical protein E5676_scaffold952G00240 [Cucumis melo var. makuwa]